MAKTSLIFTILILFSIGIMAQDRAPSCWLRYQDNQKGDILITSMKVQSPSPLYTYYCGLQWNAGQEGGGYCGMQEHPEGRNFIFSVWDPIQSSESIEAAYQHPGTEVQPFGGEGTGLKSWNFEIGWEADQWYSLVTRTWDINGHTMFGFWIHDHQATTWHHLVTMDYPVRNTRFTSSTGAFIEDWLGNGWLKREIHQRNGWKRSSIDLSWLPFNTAIFQRVQPDNGAVNYINNYDGGVQNNYFFMKSGGTTAPVTNTSNSRISIQADNNHGFPIGQVLSSRAHTSKEEIEITWVVDSSKSPQFSFNLELFDNANLAGQAIYSHQDSLPHFRRLIIPSDFLDSHQTYYYTLSIRDIFDNISELVVDSFYLDKTVSQNASLENDLFECYPNPFHQSLKFIIHDAGSYKIEVYNSVGDHVISITETLQTGTEILDLSMVNPGCYFVRLTNQSGISQVVRTIKQ